MSKLEHFIAVTKLFGLITEHFTIRSQISGHNFTDIIAFWKTLMRSTIYEKTLDEKEAIKSIKEDMKVFI